MVNWTDPETIAIQSFALVKFVHVLDGLYLWEYLSTLGYEWDVITRKRPWRWTMAIYFGCRISTLGAIIADLTGFGITTEFDCKGWLVSLMFFSYLALALATLLIVMRSIALWERRISVVVIMLGIWLVNVAFLLYGISLADAAWSPATGACAIRLTARNRDHVIVTLCTDVVLFVIMLRGVMRHRHGGSLWRMAWRQGIIWLALATLAEVLPTTFLCLNLNDPMNLMFQTLALITMTISATRIYRNLQHYGHAVVGASYLTDVQFATNPEISGITRRTRFGSAMTSNIGAGSLDVNFPKSFWRYREELESGIALSPITEGTTAGDHIAAAPIEPQGAHRLNLVRECDIADG